MTGRQAWFVHFWREFDETAPCKNRKPSWGLSRWRNRIDWAYHNYMGALTDLVLAICRCSKNSMSNSTFSISRPRIAFIRESVLKNARTLDFLDFYFLPSLKIRLEQKVKNTFVKRHDLQNIRYKLDNFGTKCPTYPMNHYWSLCCNQTAISRFNAQLHKSIFHFLLETIFYIR